MKQGVSSQGEAMSWLLLSDCRATPERLLLRFVPECFEPDSVGPVVEVTVDHPEGSAAAGEALDRFREDVVISIDATSRELRLLGELDDEETVLSGTSVSVRNVAYSADELMSIARCFHEQLGQASRDKHRLSTRLGNVEHFICELMERAARRSELSTKAHPLAEARADVLGRVLVKLRES
ncbi:hypothetical protein FKV24_001390 [Lysobacter maris]|uniref:Uncharacterized protein n=1 Tax=Marilutibacter maris TaxID=1605891 RepID=A0A508BAD1_9GAMM|nr:hypothetical protein [Lysobacter maris]KAB8198577.1 hypothetical protein FKV24_001390 [Lysobacter maris]